MLRIVLGFVRGHVSLIPPTLSISLLLWKLKFDRLMGIRMLSVAVAAAVAALFALVADTNLEDGVNAALRRAVESVRSPLVIFFLYFSLYVRLIYTYTVFM